MSGYDKKKIRMENILLPIMLSYVDKIRVRPDVSAESKSDGTYSSINIGFLGFTTFPAIIRNIQTFQ